MITLEDFTDWKTHPVTQVFFASIVEKINLGATELSYSAGNDLSTDRFKCGMIAAYRAILDVEIEELKGENENA